MLGLVNLQQALIDAREAALVALVDDRGQLLLGMALLEVYLYRGKRTGKQKFADDCRKRTRKAVLWMALKSQWGQE